MCKVARVVNREWMNKKQEHWQSVCREMEAKGFLKKKKGLFEKLEICSVGTETSAG
jgi:hypothetical protein